MITISNISYSYGSHVVLKSLSLSLPETGITHLIGKNGVGKTTFLRFLGGMLKTRADIEPESARLVFIDRECLTLDFLTVKEFLSMFTLVDDCYKSTVQALVSSYENTYVHALSLGQSSRLVFALLAYIDADVLLLDEPFNGLDDEGRAMAYSFLEELGRSKHIIFSTHEKDVRNNIANYRLHLVDPQRLVFC
ncbi:MAG: ATP-binding cassette domain-containing protein [Actinomycetaceae bacterium]|nr:ATP-binding cassette domain-containing protein [Actinomycetaceae bacterium]